MKTQFFFLLMTVILFGCATVQTQKTPQQNTATFNQTDTQYAAIEVLNDKQQLGPIRPGEVLSGFIEIKNIGDAPLQIELASACICTQMDWPRMPVAPGETTRLPFVYDSNKKRGACGAGERPYRG